MQHEEKRLNCEKHPDSELSVIYIGDNPSNESRFLCIECVLQGGEQYKNQGLSKLIKIKDFFTNPSMQYRKTISDENDAYIQEIDKCIKQLIIFLQKFQWSIQTHLEQLKQSVKSLKIISLSINYEIEIQSNFNGLRKQFQTIKTMDSFQGTQEFKKIQEDVDTLSKNLPKFYNNAVQSIKTKQQQSIKDYKQRYTQILFQSLIFIQNDLYQMSSINIYSTYEINIFNTENLNDFSFVLQNICKGNFKYDLIYQGTVDGLTVPSYWQKCDQQSHLLTIITLKNGNIFGGYSPCQLNKALGNYVADYTDSSFIFQQNKKEIYKLKDKDKAIWCYENYGPIFGAGHDFYVNHDFKSISSNLGHLYDISGYQVQNQKTHLIGEQDTELIECKVYKITQFL